MADYPPGMTLRPITAWPFAYTRERRRSPFSATLGTTLADLDVELRHLGGGRHADTVLQIAMREQDFRLDGLPRAHAVAEHPGVILAIDAAVGALSYPCDTFTRWQDNLRAITLGLRALRAVERYGITQTGQQYRGWQAIEAPRHPSQMQFTIGTAEQFIRGMSDQAGDGLDLDSLPQVFRRARAATHPDRNDGDSTQWNLVEEAGKLLRSAGKL